MENENIEVTKKSKYNSGVAKEIRRNKLWEEANNHSRVGNFVKWNEDLDCVWRELCVDIKKEEFESKRKEFYGFDEKILDIGQLVDNMDVGFKKPDGNFFIKRANHYKILKDKEVFLRRLENELGKGTAYEDEEDDEF